MQRPVTMPMPSVMRKIVSKQRLMTTVPTFSEVIVKIKQKIAARAVFHAIRRIPRPMVHYAKVVFIIGGIEPIRLKLQITKTIISIFF